MRVRGLVWIASLAWATSCGGSPTPASPPPSEAPAAEQEEAPAAEQDERSGGAVTKAEAPAKLRALTKDEVRAAREAAEKRVRSIANDDAAKACRKLPMKTPTEQAAAAACFTDANYPGFALQLWKRVQQRGSDLEREAAAKIAGVLLEEVGRYDAAADAYLHFGKKYSRNDDARASMIRGTCILRELGDERQAKRAFEFITKMRSRIKTVDYESLCDEIRPVSESTDPNR